MSTSISLGDLGTAIINDKNLAIYPTQTNNAGKFLSTDGTNTSWADGGGNTDGFLSGLTVSGSGSNGLDLAFTRNNDTNINFSIPKYTIHTTAFNDGTLTIQQFHNNDKTVDILPTQSSNSGKFLTTDGTTLSWGEASGGQNTTYPKIDARSLSGNNLTLQNTNGTTSTISAGNILWGNRAGNYIIENTLIARRNNTIGGGTIQNGLLDPNLLGHHNGYRANPDTKNEMWFPFGHVKYSFRQNYQMRYNAFYIHTYYSNPADLTMGIYASNDGITWTELTTFDYDTSPWTDGYQSSTQTLGGESITFPARSGSDVGLPHTSNANTCRRYTFANSDYYLMYMLKWIAWGDSDYHYLSDTSWITGIVSTGHEFEWG